MQNHNRTNKFLATMLLFTSLILASGCAQISQTASSMTRSDSTWFVFLERGKPTPADKDAVSKMQAGHLANFGTLFAEQKLTAAGPLSDPSGNKRGIVVVNAPNKETLQSYFTADQYVRDGYMTLNARRATAHRPLNRVSTTNMEELRIILIARPKLVLDSDTKRIADAFLQTLVDSGTVSAWYGLEDGPVSDVLFVRGLDSERFKDLMSQHPSAGAMGQEISIWPQYLGKGVAN